jgi:hypothetical protein
MGNILDCCFKTNQTNQDPLSIEEVYESFQNEEEYWYLKETFKKWYDDCKKVSWKPVSSEDVRTTYSKDEYNRGNYVPFE